MTDTVWTRNEIDSPCVRICMLHPDTGLCIGCKRSRDEIAIWSRLSPEARQRVMDDLPTRRVAPAGRRGGRAARLADQ
jgi:predicted Fe-S protein YdhL (DUF1289 family)